VRRVVYYGFAIGVGGGVAWVAIPPRVAAPAIAKDPRSIATVEPGCVPCESRQRVLGPEEFFSERTNELRGWLLSDLPAQDSWSSSDIGRLVALIGRAPEGGEEVWQSRLIRSWGLLTIGSRLARRSPADSDCEALLIDCLRARLDDSDPAVRYAAASALLDAGLIDVESLEQLLGSEDPEIARLIGWRLGPGRSRFGHAQPG